MLGLVDIRFAENAQVDPEYVIPVARIIGTWEHKAAPYVQEYPKMDISARIGSELVEVLDEMPDGVDIWDWVELHTAAKPEDVARVLFASLPQAERDGYEENARFHLDGVREYNDWDAVRVWIESDEALESYIPYHALRACGLIIAVRTHPDGTTSEFLCKVLGSHEN